MPVRKLEETRVEAKTIAFMWFNDYSGVAIKTMSRTLVVDPVNIAPNAFGKIDAVLITHDHYDHLDRNIVREICAKTGCTIVADKTSARILSGAIPSSKLREASIGEAIVVNGIIVNVEKSNHPPATTPVSFVITSEHGIKVFHTSDSLPFPAMRELGEKYKPDIAFCTVSIAPGASPRTGLEIAKLVRPKVAIPYHGDKRSMEEFIKLMECEAPNIGCKLIEKNNVYVYP